MHPVSRFPSASPSPPHHYVQRMYAFPPCRVPNKTKISTQICCTSSSSLSSFLSQRSVRPLPSTARCWARLTRPLLLFLATSLTCLSYPPILDSRRRTPYEHKRQRRRRKLVLEQISFQSHHSCPTTTVALENSPADWTPVAGMITSLVRNRKHSEYGHFFDSRISRRSRV